MNRQPGDVTARMREVVDQADAEGIDRDDKTIAVATAPQRAV
jgi:hypothetical protein